MNTLTRWAISSKRFQRCLSALTGPYATIFTLHRPAPEDGFFNGVSEALLERCLEHVVQHGYEFVSVDEVVDRALQNYKGDRPMVCVTLDDGYADQVSRLVPLLLHYQAKPTMFTITDFTDDVDWPWDSKLAYAVKNSPLKEAVVRLAGTEHRLNLSSRAERIKARRQIVRHAKSLQSGEVTQLVAEVEKACEVAIPALAPERYRPATWETLRELEGKGLRVGSHGQSHNLLKAVEDDRVQAELVHSKRRLKEELSEPSDIFCYPSGRRFDFSARHEMMVREAGYRAGLSTLSCIAYFKQLRSNPFNVPRIGFPDNFEQFARYASWLEAVRSKFPL